MSGMKTIDKIIDNKLDKLPIDKWARAQHLWFELRDILNGE